MSEITFSYAYTAKDFNSNSFSPAQAFSAAFLQLVFPDIKIVRTSQQDKLDTKDSIVFGIKGYNYYYDNMKKHNNGSPRGSFGLLFAEFGMLWLKKTVSPEQINTVFEKLDNTIVSAIDDDFKFNETKIYSITDLFRDLNMDIYFSIFEKNNDTAFKNAVELAKLILTSLAKYLKKQPFFDSLEETEELKDSCEEAKRVKKAIVKSNGKYIRLDAPFDNCIPYISLLILKNKMAKEKEILYIISKNLDNTYSIILINKNFFENSPIKPFPKSWEKITLKEFNNIFGINDTLYMSLNAYVVGSLTSAIKIAELAFITPSHE